MLKLGDRISGLGLEPQYPPYYADIFPDRGLVFVEYGEPADYVICGRDADVWSVDKTLYSNSRVMDQEVFILLLNVYMEERELP